MSILDRLLGRHAQTETRAATIENPTVPVSADNFMEFFGVDVGPLPSVSIDQALQVPAFASAVLFLSRSLANLPLHAYRETKDGAERLGGKVQKTLNEAPNAEWTSFSLRRYFWQQVFTVGRGLIWVEELGGSQFALWPLDAAKTTVARRNGKKTYTYEGKTYPADEVIDVPFMLRDDQLRVRGPVKLANDPLSVARAMARYAGGYFRGGGVPPLALTTGPLPAGADAMQRALRDQHGAIKAAVATGSHVFPVAPGYDLKEVGYDPSKGLLVDGWRFVIEEIARVLNMPPVFVGDLTHGTFTNTEQQDLHLVKHLLAQWAKALEEEVNLKVFKRSRTGRYAEHNLDAVTRGLLKDRIEAFARGIQTGQIMPDEARALENRPPDKSGAGAKLYIQGATVPLGAQPAKTTTKGGADDPGNPDQQPDA
ncbi:phage portal protein [Brevundimonas faecalis]|uniref:phage portal protein n=1 Tax=Brevundimonas faecalis TaxID=947378 RepID=UPI003609C410